MLHQPICVINASCCHP